MAIADRARDALRPMNVIEPVPPTAGPAVPGYWFWSAAVHPARHFDRAADAAAAFDGSPAQERPAVIAVSPDGSARHVATTLRIDSKPGVPGFEKSVGDFDKAFAAACEAVRPARRGPAEAASGRAPGDGKQPAYATEPESVAKSYYIEDKDGVRRYFDDYQRKALALRATETSISSKREDLKTVRAMLDIAQARGWHSVDIRGSAEFRREAWIEVTVRGLEGRGYAPSDPDRQEADRRRTERGPSNEVRTQAVAGQGRRPQEAPAAPKEPPAPIAVERPQDGPAGPGLAADRKVLRDAQRELSADGRLVLAALSEKIERQMKQHHSELRAEMKAFAAAELVKKERSEGPIVLAADHKRAATAPEPTPAAPRPAPVPRHEPEAPRRSLGR